MLSLLQSIQKTHPVLRCDNANYSRSNGIDLDKYKKDERKEAIFREHFKIEEGQPVVVCAGLYFRRKGIEDFVKVAEKMPHVRFIWLGSINKWLIPSYIRKIVEGDHPANVEFPGYFKGAVFQGAMSGADAFSSHRMRKQKGLLFWKLLLVISMLF